MGTGVLITMRTIEMQNFIRRCRMQNWWKSFEMNLSMYRHGKTPEDYMAGLEEPQKDFINLAFVWANTNEGEDYWINIRNETRSWAI